MLTNNPSISSKEYEVLFSLYSPDNDLEKAVIQFKNACETQYDVIGVHSTIIPTSAINSQPNKKVLVRFSSEATDKAFRKRLDEFVSIISSSLEDDVVVWHTHVWRFETKGAPPHVESFAEQIADDGELASDIG